MKGTLMIPGGLPLPQRTARRVSEPLLPKTEDELLAEEAHLSRIQEALKRD